jgi:hypothetical protein
LPFAGTILSIGYVIDEEPPGANRHKHNDSHSHFQVRSLLPLPELPVFLFVALSRCCVVVVVVSHSLVVRVLVGRCWLALSLLWRRYINRKSHCTENPGLARTASSPPHPILYALLSSLDITSIANIVVLVVACNPWHALVEIHEEEIINKSRSDNLRLRKTLENVVAGNQDKEKRVRKRIAHCCLRSCWRN